MGAAPNTYARAFHTAEGATNELHATLERARDERFRLLRLIKEVETRLASSAPPAPTEKIARLTDKVQNLDDALNHRFARLSEVESRIDKRVEQLGRLEQAIRDLTDRFGERVQHARDFEQVAAEAGRRMQIAGDAAVDASRDRLEQLAADAEQQAQQHLDRHVERLAAEQVDRCLVRLSDRFNERMADFESQMDEHIEQARQDAMRRFEAERDAIVAQLDQQHRRMLDQLAADLAQQHQDALGKITRHVDGIEAAFAQEIGSLVDSANRTVQQTAERFNGNIESQIAAARRQAEAASAAVEQELRRRIDETRAGTDAIVTMLEQQYAERIEALPHRAADAVDAAERDARDRLTRLQGDTIAQVERTIAPLRKQVIEALQRVHRQAGEAKRHDVEPTIVPAKVLDLIRRLNEPAGDVTDAARDAA